jgi:glycosyltransferase involved in cell wall biosynthesis
MSAEPRRHRVLMFAFFFPPLGGGGVQRTLKHVKYLPSEGFRSIVIAGTPSAFPVHDATLVDDIPPGTVVIRARTVPLHRACWKLEGLARRVGVGMRAVAQIGWPDPMIGWFPAVLWHGLRAAGSHRPHVLYSTSPPITAHLAALLVHQRTGIPWVADFRDGWTTFPHADPLYAPLARASAMLETKVVSKASFVVTADESVRLVGVDANDPRSVIVRNGVDAADLASSASLQPDPGRFVLSYVGSLYDTRDGAPVIDAIKRMLQAGRLDRRDFELRVVGDARLDEAGLRGLPITRTGYVGHRKALEEMRRASALLFYSNPENCGSTGKIYEYLAVGRPILCVAGADNLGYRLVERLRAGECVEPGNDEGVACALERLMTRWRAGTLGVDPAVCDETVRQFSRRDLASQLAAVLRAAAVGVDVGTAALGDGSHG